MVFVHTTPVPRRQLQANKAGALGAVDTIPDLVETSIFCVVTMNHLGVDIQLAKSLGSGPPYLSGSPPSP